MPLITQAGPRHSQGSGGSGRREGGGGGGEIRGGGEEGGSIGERGCEGQEPGI